MSLFVYLLIMVVVTNGIRILPVLLLSKPIKNPFLQSFLYYVPYITLAVMTFPAIMEATSSPLYGLVALLLGCLAAWMGWGLFPVSALCCAVVLVMHYV